MEIVIFLLGLILGGFLIIFIDRIPRKLPIIKTIKPNNLKTLIFNSSFNTYLKRIRFRHFLIILLSAILFLISYLQFGINILLIKALVFDSILIVVSFIDLEHQIIPNKIIIFTLAMGLIFLLSHDISIVSALGGMAAGGGILFLLALIPRAMGGGDIKFMFAIGLFLGVKKVLAALYLSFLLGAFISLIILIFRIKNRKEHIPFGPILSVGSFIAFHFFEVIINYYYSFV